MRDRCNDADAGAVDVADVDEGGEMVLRLLNNIMSQAYTQKHQHHYYLIL